MRIHGYMLVFDIPWKCLCVSNHWILGYIVDKVMPYFEKWGVSQNSGYMWITLWKILYGQSKNWKRLQTVRRNIGDFKERMRSTRYPLTFLSILQYLRNICKSYDENCVILYEIPVLCCLCTACELSEYCYKDFTHNYCHQYKISYSSNFTEWFSILCTKCTYSNKQKQNSTLCQQDLKGCGFR